MTAGKQSQGADAEAATRLRVLVGARLGEPGISDGERGQGAGYE
jgi:hypothetical protein